MNGRRDETWRLDGDLRHLFPGCEKADRLLGVTDDITPIAELDAERGTKPASMEDYERLTADDPADGEG